MSACVVSRGGLLSGYLAAVPALVGAMRTDVVRVSGATLRIPGSPRIRASVIAGNVRMRALIDALVKAGDTVVDVGANIGAVAVHAALRVGTAGRVVAIEPADDNLTVLHENVARNGAASITVIAGAAGRRRERRTLFLRGADSAVNSFYAESCYATVSGQAEVEVWPLDELVDGRVRLVKIDVEGAELEVLEGMPGVLAQHNVALVVEWHPTLQRAAGHEADQLPRWLLDRGFALQAAGHLSCDRLARHDIEPLMQRLLSEQRPVEIVAMRDLRSTGFAD